MYSQRTTIKDIAKECGVSLSTVSLVLNKSPRISEATRSKVLAAVAKHDYQPNVQAQGLVNRSSMVLSVTVPALTHVFADIYFGEIVSGIYDRATAEGYKILLDLANEQYVRDEEYISLLKTRRVDGMLFIASAVEDEYLRVFEKEPYPFLLVNHYFPDSGLNFISIDYGMCGRLAADHLVDLGHRAIGLIAGTNTFTGLDFKAAFFNRCRERGLDENDLIWEAADWDEEGGLHATEKLLARHPGLTAIMGSNDRMAIGAIRYLNLCGRSVPDDISIMGMDDIRASRFTTPALTTIRLDLYEIGRLSCERLLDLVKNNQASCMEFLPAAVVQRESTRPARS